MGTPEFAVPSLEAVLSSRHEVVVVITGPDKPVGRSRRLTENAVKRVVREHNIPILQPSELRDPFFIRAFAGFNPDICVVVAFRILPPEIFSLPPLGCINLHPSLLPELRGAAPIAWALIRGMTETGVTIFQIERKVDTGGILLQKKVDIRDDDDAGSLSKRLSRNGADLIVETLDRLEAGNLDSVSQQGESTSAPRITREICKINWNLSAVDIHNLIRGLSPAPGAFSILDGKVLKIFRTYPHPEMESGDPGTVILTDKTTMYISTGEGCIRIMELQLEGKKRMAVEVFLRGHQLLDGTKLI